MDQVRKLFNSLTVTQRIAILFVAVSVVGGVMWFSRWQRESGMRPLYTALAPEDAGAIVAKLRESGIDYRVTENGTTLMVPDAKAPELRLQMAGLGLPKTGRIGFEIFDKTSFGITDFAEHVNYRRAVEGELERSIMALAEVQQARVHVTLPKESLFLEAREAAKASILVGLRPGARLSQQNVNAITNLVSSAVEGLTPESVSVVDLHGNLLSRPRRDLLADGGQNTEAALEYRQAIERDLMLKVNNTLEPLLGADRFRTGVSAEVDLTSGEQSEESFDPSKSVMVSSQKSEDTSGTTHAATSPPGAAANLPVPAPAPAPVAGATTPAATTPPATTPPAPGTSNVVVTNAPPIPAPAPTRAGNSSSKRSESISYQTSRTTKHVKLPQGTIKRLSVAVLVDQPVHWEGEGKTLHRIVTPPTPEKLKTIQSVVAALVGLNVQRGDQLTVETLPFDGTANTEPPAVTAPGQKKTEPATPLEMLKSQPILWGAVGGGVLISVVLFAGLMRSKKKRAAAVEVTAPLPLAAAPVVDNSPASLPMMNRNPSMAALPASRTEVLMNQLQEVGKNNPEQWVGILRGWLAEEEAS